MGKINVVRPYVSAYLCIRDYYKTLNYLNHEN
jgi:hypothetical protein